MSEDSENEQKKAQPTTDSAESQQDDSSSQKQVQPKKTAPMIGRPIGTPRPTSTPIAPTASSPPSPTTTPVASRPVGTPRPAVGTPRPTVGTAVAPRPSVGSAVAKPGAAQPVSSLPTAPKTPPQKPIESKVERSRRNFIKGLAFLGGLAAVVSYVPLFPFLDGSVGAGTATPDLQLVQNPNLTKNQLVPITPSDVDAANGTVFQYPYEIGDSNVNSDSFVQCVLIQLPQGFSGQGYSVQDPKTGKNYIAFSRVCVHLWCLWSYNINDPRGPVAACPCHGSTYVPGSGTYPLTPAFSDQSPGTAVAGPASLQTAPNNMLPIIQLRIASDGSFHAIGRVGQVGCGQKC